MAVNIQEKIEFIVRMKLAEPQVTVPPEFMLKESPADSKAQGYVVGGSLIAFTENVKGQAKQDILDATLFAQLTSDHKYNSEQQSQIEDWYQSYVSVLQSIGFVGRPLNFVSYTAKGDTFTMDEVVLYILKDAATKEQSTVVKKVIEAFKSLSDKQAAFRMSRTIITNDKMSGSFHLFSCEQNPSGDVVTVIGAFYFNDLKPKLSRVFTPGYQSSGAKVYGAVTTLLYTQQSYSQVRSYVTEKLSDRAEQLTAEIEI